MNIKIKELAEKCGFYFYDLHNVGGQDLGETIESDRWSSMEDFAKLIIQECISVLNHRTSGSRGEELLDEEVDECIKSIKRHFDIE